MENNENDLTTVPSLEENETVIASTNEEEEGEEEPAPTTVEVKEEEGEKENEKEEKKDQQPEDIALPESTPNSPTLSPLSDLPPPPAPPTVVAPTPVVPTKKFQSISVNKKFLEKAGEKAKPEVKTPFARLSTPPISTQASSSTSSSHPRLLTGKISAGTSVTLTTAHTIPGVTGWNKTAPSPAGINSSAAEAQRRALPSQQDFAGRSLGGGNVGLGGAFAETARGQGGPGGFGIGGRGGAVWGAAKGGQGTGGNPFRIGGDFPTAAEAANAKQLRATALLEQMQSRDRAVQARAAAAAAANAHLLEGLDAFRGVHLDPNASHWDEMGDEDNDFLDDTIEFGDGTQYKIEAEHPPHPDFLAEPHPSDFATLEAPLAPGEEEEVATEPISREERFKDDFDRTWSNRPAAAAPDAKNLFNERLGKFEPYAGKKGTPGVILNNNLTSAEPTATSSSSSSAPRLLPTSSSSTTTNDHSSSTRRPSITSPRVEPSSLPPAPTRSAWGREPGRAAPEWRESGAGTGSAPRRPSIDQKTLPPRRSSIEPPAVRRPSVDTGARQLPPHLAAAAAASSTASAVLPPSRPHAPSNPSTAHSSSLAPIPPTSESRTSVVSPPAAPAPVVDLVELHAREMHAAAERAKKRRQEEEQVRLEQVERAKKKAAEIEERIWREAAAAAAPAPAGTAPGKEKEKEKTPATVADRVDSWRKPLVAPSVAPITTQPSAPTPSGPQSSMKPSPTQILARDPSKPLSPADSLPPNPTLTSSRPLPPPSVSKPPPPVSKPPPPVAKPPPPKPTPATEERNWRRPDPPPSAKAESSLPPPPISTPKTSPATLPTSPPQLIPLPPTITPPTPVANAGTVDGPTSSPTLKQKAPSSAAAPAKPVAKKGPQLSALEDVMSRIKGAMAGSPAPSPAAATSSAAVAERTEAEPAHVSPPHEDITSPTLVPTVKLPPTPVLVDLSTPPPVPAPEEPSKPSVNSSAPSVASLASPRGRAVARRLPSRPPAPTFENRDPIIEFETTRQERSVSPPPAWKQYNVKLTVRPNYIPPSLRQLKIFHSYHGPRAPQVFSWDAPIPGLDPSRRPSRDDLFVPKYLKKGPLRNFVKLPTRRITPQPPRVALNGASTRETEMSASAALLKAALAPISTKVDPVREIEEMEDSLNATTAPTAESLFDLGPPRPKTFQSSKATPGPSVAFYRPPSATPLETVVPSRVEEKVVESSRGFRTTSELNGEMVPSSPRESLAAPGGGERASKASEEHSSVSFEALLDTTPVSSRPLSPPSSQDPWLNKTPLSLSALDPTAPSVWSAPPSEPSSHARSKSLGGLKPENSLHGLSDPDEFPAGAIPTSLADLKSEDEGSNAEEEKKVAPKPVSSDEAKLRAAAPTFAAYNNESTHHHHHPPQSSESRQPRFPAFSRQPSHPQLHAQSGSPVGFVLPPGYMPNPQAAAAAGYGPPGSHLYAPAFSIAPPQGMSSMGVYSYATPAGYVPSHSPAVQASGYAYRPNPQAITNPALIANAFNTSMSYGAIGGGSTYGVVGGSGSAGGHGAISRGGNPMSAAFLQQSPYLTAQQLPPQYRDSNYGGMDQHQQQRSSFNLNANQYQVSAAGPSPSLHPAFLPPPPPSQQGSYTGSFQPSPQLQNAMTPNGSGAPQLNGVGREGQNRFNRRGC